jgi:hypothetical protein
MVTDGILNPDNGETNEYQSSAFSFTAALLLPGLALAQSRATVLTKNFRWQLAATAYNPYL